MTPFLGGVIYHFYREKFTQKTRYQTAKIRFSKGFYEDKKIWLKNFSQKQGTTPSLLIAAFNLLPNF